MDVLSRLKSTVTGAVSSVSGALPGNPVTREFEVGVHRASAGPGLNWKVYDGIKKTTKQDASVFLFEKKSLDRYTKHDRELVVESLKKGVAQLTRLRHPKILSVLHPLEESRESLAFATEPVFASLANILGNHKNMPSPPSPELRDFELHDVEIKYGLLQVTEGLKFLHSDVKLIHCNVVPSSVIINQNGAWKLSGFDFCIRSSNPPDQPVLYMTSTWDANLPPEVQSSLDFMAPEFVLAQSCDAACDMFSLAILLHAIYNHGKPLYECCHQLATFKKNVHQLKSLSPSLLGSIPAEVREHAKLLLNTDPAVRPDADQMSKLPFFDEVGVTTMQYMDTLVQRENLQKSQFFKSLPQIVSKMPKRVNIQRMLPCLFSETVNTNMVPFILPNIIIIAEQVSSAEFVRYLLPGLIPLFKIQDPIQIMFIFLQNMSLLLNKTPSHDVQNHVLPMIYRAIESNVPQLQQLCLNIMPSFASMVEYSSLKNHIVPRIKKLCLSTSTLTLRVNSLLCFGKMLEYMDKWFVLDEIFPILQQVPSREPAVLMSILGIVKVTMSHKKLGITKDIMATKVLPFLLPLAIDSNLNLQQFNGYMNVIKEMVEKVEAEHRAKLEQLNSMEKETGNLEFTQESVQDSQNLVAGLQQQTITNDTMMDSFLQDFGMSSNQSAASDCKKNALSLEDKHRVMREQEMRKKTENAGVLTPSKASTHLSCNAAPKNLTRSLLTTTKCGQVATVGPSLLSSQSKPFSSSNNITANSLPFDVSNSSRLQPTLGNFNSPACPTTQFGNFSSLSPSFPSNAPSMGLPAQPNLQSSLPSSNMSRPFLNTSKDSSSFDSLSLGMNIAAPKVSLNQMASRFQPPAINQLPAQVVSRSAAQSAQAEFDDLLG